VKRRALLWGPVPACACILRNRSLRLGALRISRRARRRAAHGRGKTWMKQGDLLSGESRRGQRPSCCIVACLYSTFIVFCCLLPPCQTFGRFYLDRYLCRCRHATLLRVRRYRYAVPLPPPGYACWTAAAQTLPRGALGGAGGAWRIARQPDCVFGRRREEKRPAPAGRVFLLR